MRPRPILSLLLLSALLAPPAAHAARTSSVAAARATVLVIPFAAEESDVDLGYATAFKVLGAFEALDAFNLTHPKQLARALEQRKGVADDIRSPKGLKNAAVMLGARWVVTGSLKRAKDSVAIKVTAWSAADGRTASADVPGKELLAALDLVPAKSLDLLAGLGLAGVPASKLPPAAQLAPVTRNGDALVEYAACNRALMRQPISVRDPVVLDATQIREAIGHCRTASTLDPAFAEARATLGFAHALLGEQAEAEEALASVKESKTFIPDYWLGKFWTISRFYDPALAVQTLEQLTSQRPGFLIARGYLGDSYNILGKHKEALATFERYLADVPDQPWVLSRIGYSQAKLGDTAAAIEWTKKALRVSPGDPELLLEMASRFIDAGRPDDARVVLLRVIADGGGRGEVHLRLGYAYLLLGKDHDAERELILALDKAKAQSEWRTRGRARFNLAKLWMRQNAPDLALRQLEYAVSEGFRDLAVFDRDPDLAKLKGDARYARIIATRTKSNAELTPSISPFPTNPNTGDVDVGAARKPPATSIRF